MGNSAAKGSTQPKSHRRIYIGSVPEIDDNTRALGQHEKAKRPRKFASNKIITSRYTFLTFIPKTIYEQFHRFVNIYFLCVVLLQALSDSPVSPASTGAAFVFVLGASICKQAYEDFLRHRADAVLNNKKVKLVANGRVQEIKSKDIKVGNILKIEDNEQIPADLLLMGSSDDRFRCQVTTVNLDGETNFKVRYSPSGLPSFKSDPDLLKLRAILECEEPDSNLYAFHGTFFVPKSSNVDYEQSASDETSRSVEINIGSEAYLQLPVSIENVVLRGTTLKNTDFIYGLVVYTGQDTRLSQNSKKADTKFSTVEKAINTFLIAIVVILITLITTCTVLYFVLKNSDTLNPDNAFYLQPPDDNDFGHVFHIFSSFFVLFNYIIPISLYVTIELQKFFGSLFFVWDKDLYDPATDQAALCNTSDLNEELGQIEYLFTDKTGTLTENIMNFQYCSVNGVRYDFNSSERILYTHSSNKAVVSQESEELKAFLKILALCHTVQLLALKSKQTRSTDSNGNKLPVSHSGTDEQEYHASSPDEKALLEAASKLGVKYMGESESVMSVDNCGKQEKYKRVLVLEFDADRKCMSVLVENSQGEIWLFSKGAESTILPRCTEGATASTLDHVNEFAKMGMRTLVIAQRKLSPSEFDTFITKMNKARRLLVGREEAVRELYSSVESNLTVMGATGVEDQLQSGMAETLEALSEAGIHVWMLTGDKLETAINVAVSCGLMSSDKSLQVIIANCTSDAKILQELKNIMAMDQQHLQVCCCVLDGDSLEAGLRVCPDLLRDVAMKVGHVVCCRMAPLQKAQVVRMVKDSNEHPVTAAVGDGANDVAMIQEAHVGLGILGKEGRQAARSSDFALARFSFLKKAILVHGHWYYYRLAVLILYFFYKNIVFILPPAFAAIFSAFSTQTLFNPFYLTTFNIFYSSAPILAIGLQEQPVSAKELMNCPNLYKKLRRNQFLSWKQFWSWVIQGVWHAMLAFFIPVLAWSIFSPVFNDWASLGMFVISAVVALTNMQLVTETKYNTIWIFVTHGLSYLGFFVFTTIYAEVDLKGVLRPRELRHAFWTIQSHPGFWFTMVLITAMGVLPDLAWKAFWNTIRSRPVSMVNKQA